LNVASLAIGNLYRRPARSLLTIAAVALGIAAVVALTSIAWGFEASWQKANDARGTDLIVTRAASENTMPSPFLEAAPRQALKGYAHVKDVVGLLSEMLSVGESGQLVFVFGWAYKSFLWDHLKLVDGRWPATDHEAAVTMGSLAATLLHKKTGDSIELEGRNFRLVGIYESTAVVENGALLMTLLQAQQLTDKPGKVNVLNIKLDPQTSNADIDALKRQVQATMPGYVAITSGELVRQNAIVRISKAMSSATILIASLVGALVVFNTMLMSVNERTREIGVFLAVGWQKRTVIGLICCESAMLTLMGGCIGIGLGVAMVSGLEHLDLMRGKIDAVFSAPFLFAIAALSVLIGLAGGLYPAMRSANLSPSQALRQE
jgi:putative ABC transport system permease protein